MRRSLVRWCPTAIAAACVIAWATNFWAWLGISAAGFSLRLQHGMLTLEQQDDDVGLSEEGVAIGRLAIVSWWWLDDLPGYNLGSRLGFYEWMPRAGTILTSSGIGFRWYVDVPLWLPFGASTGLAALAWRSHWRRQRSGGCENCGYDLTGLASGARCPECGCV